MLTIKWDENDMKQTDVPWGQVLWENRDRDGKGVLKVMKIPFPRGSLCAETGRSQELPVPGDWVSFMPEHDIPINAWLILECMEEFFIISFSCKWTENSEGFLLHCGVCHRRMKPWTRKKTTNKCYILIVVLIDFYFSRGSRNLTSCDIAIAKCHDTHQSIDVLCFLRETKTQDLYFQ